MLSLIPTTPHPDFQGSRPSLPHGNAVPVQLINTIANYLQAEGALTLPRAASVLSSWGPARRLWGLSLSAPKSIPRIGNSLPCSLEESHMALEMILKEILAIETTLKEILAIEMILKEILAIEMILKEILAVETILKEILAIKTILKEILAKEMILKEILGIETILK